MKKLVYVLAAMLMFSCSSDNLVRDGLTVNIYEENGLYQLVGTKGFAFKYPVQGYMIDSEVLGNNKETTEKIRHENLFSSQFCTGRSEGRPHGAVPWRFQPYTPPA